MQVDWGEANIDENWIRWLGSLVFTSKYFIVISCRGTCIKKIKQGLSYRTDKIRF